MREIKFRVYNHTTKEMMFSEKLTTEMVGFLLENHKAYVDNNKPDKVFSPVMLYTGVDDCNGENIYNDDMVNIGESITSYIIWDFDSWQIRQMGMLNSIKKQGIRVVGNIYVNPPCGYCGAQEVYRNGVCEICYDTIEQ